MSWYSVRKRFVIFPLLVLTLAAFAYVRREMFLQQARNLIKQKLEKSFACQLSIEKITPSILYGLVLENLELNFPGASGLTFNVKVNQACLDYSFWEALSLRQKKDAVQRLRLISPAVNLSYARDSLQPVRAEQTEVRKTHKPTLGEFVLILEDGRISFGKSQPLLENLYGRLALSQDALYFQDLRATFVGNAPKALKIYGELTEEHFSLTANLDHLKIKDFDVLTNLTLSLDKKIDIQDGTPKICGSLKTYGSVLDNRPFPELSSSFEIRDSKLRLLSFTLGDNYDLRGIVGLTPPFYADLSLNFYEAAPHEFASQFSTSEELNFSGLFNGLIKITGKLNQPRIEGYLEAKQGHLGDLDFVSADINVKGEYPKIYMIDSRICREEDYFIMEGEIDLANLENQDFLDIRFKADKGIFWQGWDITRRHENQLHLSKSVADDLKVTFDSFMEDQAAGAGDNYTNELGLEYRVFGDKIIKLRLRKEEEILGVERRIKF
ncbi:MAG: hypothetical protein ISS43_02215 [Candidatus Omnitrophica bacterium]|nr:hypothetical protein [Candidatus Omnitrophota bacterium]